MISVFICNDLPYDVRNSIRQLPVFTFKDQSHSGPGGIYQALILIIRNFPAFYIFILAEFFCAIYAAVFPVIPFLFFFFHYTHISRTYDLVHINEFLDPVGAPAHDPCHGK